MSLLVVAPALGREWTDATGKHRIEAKLVTVKEGKVYLEKGDGAITAVGLDKLSKQDLEHLQSLPECREYFEKNPLPGPKLPATPKRIAVIPGSAGQDLQVFRLPAAVAAE